MAGHHNGAASAAVFSRSFASRKSSSVDASEAAKFEKVDWWSREEENNPVTALHAMNKCRVECIVDYLKRHYEHLGEGSKTLVRQKDQPLSCIDVGCGGGLLSESLAELGAAVTGIDLHEGNIVQARKHADDFLDDDIARNLTYKVSTVEDHVGSGTYDIVFAMEIVEHVNAPDVFLDQCAALVKPGGVLVVSSINRTLRSAALAIGAAEYVMGMVPIGTHDWFKFPTPEEIEDVLKKHHMRSEIVGMDYNPVTGEWAANESDHSVNFIQFLA